MRLLFSRLRLLAWSALVAVGLSACSPSAGEKSGSPASTEEDPGIPSAETTRIRRAVTPSASLPDDGFIHDGRLQPASAFPAAASPLAGGSDLTGTQTRSPPPANPAKPGEDPFKAIPSSVDNQRIRHEGIGLGTGAPPASGSP